jgi:methyl-accepting chemotaxis protein
MNVKQRIWSLPAIAAAIFSVGLAVSSYEATQALHSIRTTRDVDYPMLAGAESLQTQMHAIEEGFNSAVGDNDKKGLEAVGTRADTFRGSLKSVAAIPGATATTDRLSGEFDVYFDAANHAARLMMGIENGDPQQVVTKMQNSLKTLNADLDATRTAAQQEFTAGVSNSEAGIHFVIFESVALAIVILGMLALVSYFVVRAIWKDLGGEPGYARNIARAVAAGDLSMTIDRIRGDDSSLLAALDEMKRRLAEMVTGIHQSSEAIRHATSEIAAGNSDLSARTEAQATSLGETASSIEELTSTVLQNADSARHANALVIATADIAAKGGSAVGNVVRTMGEIHASASKIADITGVIDGIAFQTNILALNAAVEAARAGEQGRGFAVVASEVRSLAQRSASAAKEIKALIGASVDMVETGSRLVEDAGKTMDEIVASVQSVTQIMAAIAAASAEQSRGIELVNITVSQMDEATQRNAAMTEQASAAAQSLDEQVGHLYQAINVFKLERAGGLERTNRPR